MTSDESKTVDLMRSTGRRGIRQNVVICATAEIIGPHSLEIFRACVDKVLRLHFGRRLGPGAELIDWVDTTGLTTIAEAGVASVLGDLQRLVTFGLLPRTLFRAASTAHSPIRSFVAIAANTEVCEARLLDLIRNIARVYADATQTPFETTTRLSGPFPPGMIVNFPFNAPPGDSDMRMAESFQRLVAAHCVVAWLITGFDRVEIDLCLQSGSVLASKPVSLTFNLSGNPTLDNVLRRVQAVLSECKPCRPSLPIRSAILHSYIPDESFRIGEACGFR
jgi:hypothetical protein